MEYGVGSGLGPPSEWHQAMMAAAAAVGNATSVSRTGRGAQQGSVQSGQKRGADGRPKSGAKIAFK